jgi:drug/metabolite transporter (DMT)-like permease
VALAATWGASFLFIKVLADHWSALWVAFGRVAIGAITLVVLVGVRRERFPRDPRVWLHCLVLAVFFNAVPWTLFAYGEQHTSSIVAGLWNATTPLWVLVVSLAAFGEERPTAHRIGGLAIGFLGVVTLLGPWRGVGHGALIGHLACAAGALCYGLGFPYTRRFLIDRKESGVVLSGCQLVCATALLAVFLPFTRSPTVHIGLDGLGSLLALGALGSGIAFAVNYAIVRAKGIAVASTVTYLIPVFSTALGALVLGETLHWNQLVGTAVLLSGIALTQERSPRSWYRRRYLQPAPAVSTADTGWTGRGAPGARGVGSARR